jgi:hypothetical protein
MKKKRKEKNSDFVLLCRSICFVKKSEKIINLKFPFLCLQGKNKQDFFSEKLTKENDKTNRYFIFS